VSDISRRDFVVSSGSCAAHLALAASVMPRALRHAWTASSLGTTIAREPFGSLERVADGVWALISTPLNGDRTTLCNGGLIVGRNAVLAIEGFGTPQGAQWLAGKAHELTGRWPTHIALTHYHSDHANGVAGYFGQPDHPQLHTTQRTRELVIERNQPADPSRVAVLNEAITIAAEPSTLDLGGRIVHVIPRRGHTESDVSLELDDPSIVFGGDLIWNAMFPNYVDAMPTELAQSVRAIRRTKDTVYVPGHGPLARQAEFDRYASMLDEVARAARASYAKGTPAAEAGAAFSLPPSLGEWVLFSKAFYERAFSAWYRELGTGKTD
jgi:glyoxylase-like metal-dependent hydrolase (beta-lactamase superfamily II)